MSNELKANHLDQITAPMQVDHDRFQSAARQALHLAQAEGASQAAIALSVDQGVSVTVRNEVIETLEAQQDQGFGVTVFVGKRKGNASTSALTEDAIAATVRKAISIAKFTVEDEYAGLADAELMANESPDLDLFHPYTAPLDTIIERARVCESAARDYDDKISNSEGATLNTHQAYSLYANSHGFTGEQKRSSSSASVSVIAEHAGGMERDYWYDVAVDAQDLNSAESIGRKAGERTVKRLGAQKLSTRKAPVLFVPEMARGLFGAAISALGGMSQYRESTFLLKAQGEAIFPDFVDLTIKPHLPKALGSAAYDAEGVATYERDLVKDGIVQGYVMGSYSARKLGLKTTANAGGVQNVIVNPSGQTLTELIKAMHTGLLVTEMMGQGINGVTGDYSRGAAGFWVENGEIQYPVAEITIASNLKQMYGQIQAVGNDVDRRGNVQCGSVLIEEMMIAGE